MALCGADVANHDLAVVYAYSDLDGRQSFCGKFLVQFSKLFHHIETASDCRFTGIVEAARCAEQDHHAITHKFIHGPVEAVHRANHAVEIAG